MTSDANAQLLDRTRVAVLLIDLQYQLLSTVFEPERVLRNAQRLLRLAGALGLPLVLTTQDARGLGNIHADILRLARDKQPFDKTSFGCFADEGFRRHLKAQAPEATTVLLAGIESHIGVTQTALGGLSAGYIVHVAADATSSRTFENWQIGLNRMERAGAVISSTEMTIYELLGRTGTPEFNSVLPLLR